MMPESYSSTWIAEARVGENVIAPTFFAHLCDPDRLQVNSESPLTCRHKNNIKAMCKASQTK
jgi:hypothetical protein